MKSRLCYLLCSLLLSSVNLMAQNWITTGNTLNANGTFGTTSNHSILFKANNKESGRLTNNGLWGFGTKAPNSKVDINSITGQNVFQAQVNNNIKLLVHNDGGVSIGSGITPPANGLFVFGNMGIGTSAPDNTLHVFKGSAGNVTGYINAPLIVENSTHAYINILAPDENETGILFGKPADNSSGGIIYNNAANLNGFQFRTNDNQIKMILSDKGNLGIGVDPTFYKLKINNKNGEGGFAIGFDGFPDTWELFNELELAVVFNLQLKGRFSSADGTYSTVSDERLKTNIKPMDTILNKIMQLKPSSYQFKNTTDKQIYNGFIAQDVMKLFPSMVAHTVNPERNWDVYTMNYSQFGVLAIKGIQELEPVIEEQKKKIATLENRLAKLEAFVATITSDKNETANNEIVNTSLEQNNPNPFSISTTIHYSIPEDSKGQINLYNQTGRVVKVFDANETGQLILNAQTLLPGTYLYALIINGKLASSKQMIIIK